MSYDEHADCDRQLNEAEDRILKLQQRIKELKTEMQEVSNQLMDLYDKCQETTKPEVYGTILGLHERLEKLLPIRT